MRYLLFSNLTFLIQKPNKLSKKPYRQVMGESKLGQITDFNYNPVTTICEEAVTLLHQKHLTCRRTFNFDVLYENSLWSCAPTI